MKMELAIKDFQARNKLETVIVRVPWFYGPNQPPRQAMFFRMIRRGKVPVLGSGENLRSMGYIDNLCEGMILAGRNARASGEVFWIADERPYSWNEIIRTIEDLLERDFGLTVARKRMRLPDITGTIAEGMDWMIQAAGLYNQKFHVLSEVNKNIACSIKKAKRVLGYRPNIELEEGMRRSIQWCLDRNIEL